NLRLPGQYADAESGYYYNLNRYYAPELGRYLSEDPIGLEGGITLYSYVNQSPFDYVDPTGEIGLPGAAIGGLVGGVSAFTGALATGSNLPNALVAGGVGTLIGAGTGFLGGFGIGVSAVIGGTGNFLGQTIGNNIDGDPCNNSDINLGSVIGSAIGGGWAAGITRGAGPISGAIIGWGPSVAPGAIGTAISNNPYNKNKGHSNEKR
ncbi:MAG: RHS repeat-associated core domain-containing protein, partial [Venatoribacter sp.]